MAFARLESRQRAIDSLLAVVSFRELLRNLILKELKLRYRRSVLGFVWTMLNPLLMMVVITVAFSTIMKFSMANYSIFLLSALLPWTMFIQATTGGLRSIVDNAHLIHKVYVPKAVFPLAVVGSSLVNFFLSLIPLFLLMVALGVPLRPAVLILPLAIVILAIFTTGTALIFSCLNVFYRDFTHMTPVLLSAWFYLTPIIYPINILPASYQPYLKLNPMYHVVKSFRSALYYGHSPSLLSLGYAGLFAMLLLVVGWFIFQRYEHDFVFYV